MPPSSESASPRAPNPRDWEETFRRGEWSFLAEMGEAPRNALVAGYIHRLVGAGRVLDVGCGEGVLLEYLDLSRIDYSGFDVSPTAVERARGKVRKSGAKLFVGAMDDYGPQGAERFDAVVFNESLSYSPTAIATLRRYLNLLTPSGWLLLSQFQTYKPGSDAAYFVPLLQAELDSGRLVASHVAEASDCGTGVRWRLYAFPAAQPEG